MQHLSEASKVGWSQAEIKAIKIGDQTAVAPKTAVLLRFVDECVYRVKVSDATFSDTMKYFSEQEIAEATLLIGHYMMTARFLENLEIDLDTVSTSWDHM